MCLYVSQYLSVIRCKDDVVLRHWYEMRSEPRRLWRDSILCVCVHTPGYYLHPLPISRGVEVWSTIQCYFRSESALSRYFICKSSVVRVFAPCWSRHLSWFMTTKQDDRVTVHGMYCLSEFRLHCHELVVLNRSTDQSQSTSLERYSTPMFRTKFRVWSLS